MFSSTNAFSPDGTPLPIAELALQLDDETQYRCAGYIQAEIERYAEFLDDEDDEDKSQKSDDEGSDDDNDDAPVANGDKPVKSRKSKKIRKEGWSLSRFIRWISHNLVVCS